MFGGSSGSSNQKYNFLIFIGRPATYGRGVLEPLIYRKSYIFRDSSCAGAPLDITITP